jgi:PIN domain nuclease of toxin-antitoxin system
VSLLADACALIVFHGYAGQTMSHAGKAAISAGDVFVSPITVWEITRKVATGKLERPAPPGFNGTLSEWLRQAGYRILPLTWEVCERANALPMHHKDPMDRMLIAAALDRGLTIVTDDTVFAQYGVQTIW